MIAPLMVFGGLTGAISGALLAPLAAEVLMDAKLAAWDEMDRRMERALDARRERGLGDPDAASADTQERELALWLEDQRRIEKIRAEEAPAEGEGAAGRALMAATCGISFALALGGLAEGLQVWGLFAYAGTFALAVAALCDLREHCLPWELSAIALVAGVAQDAALVCAGKCGVPEVALGACLFFGIVAISTIATGRIAKKSAAGAGDWKALPAVAALCAPAALLSLWALAASMLVALVVHAAKGGKAYALLPFGPHLAVAQVACVAAVALIG